MFVNRLIQAMFAFLAVGIFALAYLAQKPLCIDSSLVEKIDRIDSAGMTSAYSCQFKRKVSIDPQIMQSSPQLAERLYPLERFFSEFGPLKKQISIEWLSDQAGKFKTASGHITLSTDLLNKPLLLEKVIAREWVQERLPVELKDDSILIEALADLIIYVNYSPDIGESQARWPHVLKTFSGYCQNAIRAPEHKDICEQAAIDNPQVLDQLTPYSLQPLLAQTLVSVYLKQSPSQRYKWLKSFARGQWQWRPVSAASYLGLSEWAQISSEIENFAQRFPENISVAVEAELNQRGFFPSKSKASFDLVFILPEEDNLQKDLLPKLMDASQKNPKLMISAEDSMRVWLLPSKDFLTRSLMQSYYAQRAVWLKCEPPSLNDFKNMAERFDRVLLLSDCQKNIDANLKSYVSGGIEAFAADNQKLRFVQLHIPSLMQALKKSEANPIPLLGLQQFSHPFFKGMGWQGATWIENLRAYRSRSAIEAIEMYRMQN